MECLSCGHTPDEIAEYVQAAADENVSPEDYVRTEEGTFNAAIQRFWCTACYIKIGMPLGVAR